ncbi:MAG: 2-dehydropantoate 2-reductase [Gemmataceae bacterium]|nr:2-dehydropantoate 2-reductase [Gemmataceae bacterium]MDW8266533.1 hypothetical protein [Gemmataceae bacterium]
MPPAASDPQPCRTLILGASYGSLLGTKLLLAGHPVTLVCTRSTAELIRREGTVVRFPLRGREIDVPSAALRGKLSAVTPEEADPSGFDLAVLAMQEGQYAAPGVRELMRRIAGAGVPCLAVMNMPPLPFLRRLPVLREEPFVGCYAAEEVWAAFPPEQMTLTSADPQAFRPPDRPKNCLQVSLPTNFKAAPFEEAAATALLRRLAADIEAARFDAGDGPLEIPVKLKVHDSLFVPLAKWPMLLTGNYRCIRPDGIISIRDAVLQDVERAREMYAWVCELCHRLGADAADLVPFEKYAQAAEGLTRPASAARALAGGATQIERVDRLVQTIGLRLGRRSLLLDEIVALVDAWLERNRAAAGDASSAD